MKRTTPLTMFAWAALDRLRRELPAASVKHKQLHRCSADMRLDVAASATAAWNPVSTTPARLAVCRAALLKR